MTYIENVYQTSKPNYIISWLRRNHEIDTVLFHELYETNDIMFCLVGSLYFVTAVLSYIIFRVLNF